jgi:hypothetical protein
MVLMLPGNTDILPGNTENDAMRWAGGPTSAQQDEANNSLHHYDMTTKLLRRPDDNFKLDPILRGTVTYPPAQQSILYVTERQTDTGQAII